MLNPPQNLADNFSRVRNRVAAAARLAGRSESSITLLAVSKGHALDRVATLARLGQQDFGENYLQDALPKIEALRGQELNWHFIGQLQSNKTRAIAENFAWVHTLDKPKLLERLAAQRPFHAPPLQICLQIQLTAESGKGGVTPSSALALAQLALSLPRLSLRGLMCIPPAETDPSRQRHWFAQMALLQEQLTRAGVAIDTLSMGMSDDLEVAIDCGATIVRVGTAIFGPRP